MARKQTQQEIQAEIGTLEFEAEYAKGMVNQLASGPNKDRWARLYQKRLIQLRTARKRLEKRLAEEARA